jgi:hypothetical protein
MSAPATALGAIESQPYARLAEIYERITRRIYAERVAGAMEETKQAS